MLQANSVDQTGPIQPFAGLEDSKRRWSKCLILKGEAVVGGRERIRTSGRIAPTPDFESGAFNHSATLPAFNNGLIMAG